MILFLSKSPLIYELSSCWCLLHEIFFSDDFEQARPFSQPSLKPPPVLLLLRSKQSAAYSSLGLLSVLISPRMSKVAKIILCDLSLSSFSASMTMLVPNPAYVHCDLLRCRWPKGRSLIGCCFLMMSPGKLIDRTVSCEGHLTC